MALPMMMIQMSKITDMIVRDSKSEYTSSANLLVKDALYDLYALDRNDFDFTKKIIYLIPIYLIFILMRILRLIVKLNTKIFLIER